MLERVTKAAWIAPVLAASVPVALLLFGWMLNLLGYNGYFVLPAFWLLFVSAPLIGLLTLMILRVQGNLNRAGMKQRRLLYAALFAAFDMAAPVWLLAAFLVLLKPES